MKVEALVETQGIDRDKSPPTMICHLWIGEFNPRIHRDPQIFYIPVNDSNKKMKRNIKGEVVRIVEQGGHEIKAEDIRAVYK